MNTQDTLISLGISLGIGLLIGMQRERRHEQLAGIRTFALLSLFGTIAGLVGEAAGGNALWMVAAGALAVGIIMGIGAYLRAQVGSHDIGLTTEIAALVIYALGAYVALAGRDGWITAVVVGGAVVLLLYWKEMLHGFVQRMGDRDVSAIMTFVLISLVILPILPNQRYGPYQFFNPFETWLVVVLVVGMSLAGYVLYRLVPDTTGVILGGIAGGLVSSTATTVAYSRRARQDPAGTGLAAQAIMVATAVSVLRVMALLLIFSGAQSGPTLEMLAPLGMLAGFMVILSTLTCWLGRSSNSEMPEQANPTELKAALLFAAIYTTIRLATAWGRNTLGAGGLYVIGGVSGLTDVDAITLSMSEATRQGHLVAAIGWRVIMIAVMSNLIFKWGTVMVLGNRRLAGWIGVLFGAAFLAGVTIIVGWH